MYVTAMYDSSPHSPSGAIVRSEGVTASERYLEKLCRRSFLSLWSYPGVLRDQGRSNGKGDGKEVSDLLVVFEKHILDALAIIGNHAKICACSRRLPLKPSVQSYSKRVQIARHSVAIILPYVVQIERNPVV